MAQMSLEKIRFKKILVRMPNWVGDLVMATPVLTDLRRRYPDAEITAMCKAHLVDLLKHDASVDELFGFSKTPYGFLRRAGDRDLIGKLRTGQYELGILLTNSFSSAWYFFQGRITRRLGYKARLRSWLLTDGVKWPQERIHQVDFYKRLLEPLGIAKSQTAPRLYLTEAEIRMSKELLHQRGYREGAPLFGINPGAAYGSAKCWPPERFRALALQLLDKDPEAFILFFGDGTSHNLVKEIVQELPPRVLNLAGATDLRELLCLIQQCDVLVTNDSGPMHVGAALGTPLVALFGSTDDHLTGPYGQSKAVIRKNVSCSPCFERVCPIDFRCMRSITVEEVARLAMERRRSRV